MFKFSKKALMIIMAISLCFVTACSKKSDGTKEKPTNFAGEKANENSLYDEKPTTAPQSPKNNEVPVEPEHNDEKGKYSDNEVYTDENGTEYSKTEDGKEVAITGDNLQALFEEYEKVKGTGSDREKELLDQIQVILDVKS